MNGGNQIRLPAPRRGYNWQAGHLTVSRCPPLFAPSEPGLERVQLGLLGDAEMWKVACWV